MATHHVHFRLQGASRRPRRMNSLGVRAGMMGALSASAGAVSTWGLMQWVAAGSWVTALVGGGLTALAAATIVRFCQGTARALRDLEDAARQVGSGNLRVRLPRGGPAEVAGVAAAFAQMTAGLAEERGKAEEVSDSLQEMAEERTAEVREWGRAMERLRSGHGDLRRWALSIQGLAALLARDCGRRLDARGREYLEGIRADAAAMADRLGSLGAEAEDDGSGEAAEMGPDNDPDL